MNFDVIIIGGGAAGLSAALWCDDLGLSAVLLERKNETGGQLLRVYNRIENHLGVKAENGRELCNIFLRQTDNRNFTLKTGAKILKIDFENKTVFLENGENFIAEAIIIATGVSRRKLCVEGETKFVGRGILESGKRDKDCVKHKTAAIIGGGDAALENALILSETAEKVIVIHRSEKFRAREEFLEKAQTNPKIEFLTGTVVKRFIGEEKLSKIEIEKTSTGETSEISVNAVLIRIGVEPNTNFLEEKTDLDKNGYVKINSVCETSIKGVWAIGDVANPISPTVSSSVGMGATAVKAVYSYLDR